MKIGIAETNIRTPLGMQMTGYAGRAYGAVDIHDRLKMSAIYFKSNGKQSLIITCQVLGFDPDYSRSVENEISSKLNIPVSNIILSSIHTHAGPASGTLYGCGVADPNWLKDTKDDILSCAKEAVNNTFDGYFEYLTGECEIAMNRVAKSNNYENYKDMIDKKVSTIKIYEKGSDKLKSIYVNYACHPVCLTNKNHTYTADFPYYMIKKLNEHYGEDVAVIFANGCCGDINPRYRFSFDMAKKSGDMLANSVINSKRLFTNEDIEINGNEKALMVPLVNNYSKKELVNIKKECQKEFQELVDENYVQNSIKLNIIGAKIKWADSLIKKYESNESVSEIKPVIKVVNLGGINIVSLPFETFHQLGIRIKDMFEDGETFVVGYSNGVYGYLPYGELYDKSTYEAKTAFRYYGYIGPVCKQTGDIICKYIEEVNS